MRCFNGLENRISYIIFTHCAFAQHCRSNFVETFQVSLSKKNLPCFTCWCIFNLDTQFGEYPSFLKVRASVDLRNFCLCSWQGEMSWNAWQQALYDEKVQEYEGEYGNRVYSLASCWVPFLTCAFSPVYFKSLTSPVCF